jgi:hypothetical protein
LRGKSMHVIDIKKALLKKYFQPSFECSGTSIKSG